MENKSAQKTLSLMGIALIVILGICVSLFASDTAKKNELERTHADFRELSSSYVNSIVNHIDVVMEILPTTAVYTLVSGNLSEQSFYDYSRNLFDRYTSVRALAWVPKIENSNKNELENARRDEGFPGYEVHGVANKKLEEKANYFPIKYIEFNRDHEYSSRDLDLMGLDLSTVENWAVPMEEAVEHNEIIFATDSSDPVQILAFLPVYKEGSSTVTKDERRKNLIGYVCAFLPAGFLIETGLEKIDETSRQLVEVSAVDKTNEEILLYSNFSAVKSQIKTLNNTNSLEMYSRNWVLTTQPKEQFLSTHKSSDFPLMLLLAGLVTTALVGLSLLLLVTRNAKVEREVKERTEELTETYGKLRDSEVMLMQSEKMSALGQMVAGVAHELNTPLGYVRSNIQIMQEHFQDLTSLLLKMINDQEPPEGFSKDLIQPVKRLLELIDNRVDPATMSDVCNDSMDGIDHLSNIVVSLKNFSRKDMLDVEKVSVNECLDSSLMIAHSKIKSKAEVITEYGEIPKITCYPSKLNQVFLNIITNAVDSIEDFGTLHIRTSFKDEQVIVSITDTGCGMSEEERKNIFEPFHTTKDVGKGTGLGLFICDRIIDEHGGKIEVRSAPDQGSEFIIYLPLSLPESDPKMIDRKVINRPGKEALPEML